ncbi:unnamed protein product [Rotaria socialis]|uniref:NAD(P)(+)--arginine ADP-ribosyltransferase n=1 Tax=Rotaria socialis TaxID=392032 RepID=A0A817ZYT1_9BILA|nr:unnamed protein product [Rotaria socialis]CAF4657049.1 unnamed protein product [Rotaria socialis]
MDYACSTISSITAAALPKEITPRIFVSARKRAVEDFILVWLDGNIDQESDNAHSIIKHFRQIVHEIQTFTSVQECVNAVTDVKEEKVIIVVSTELSSIVVPILHPLSVVDSIYVLCNQNNTDNDKLLIITHRKVKGIFVDTQLLCEHLKTNMTQSKHDLLTFEFAGSTIQKRLDDGEDKQEATFMYFQLFKEILLTMKDDEDDDDDDDDNSLTEMIKYCQSQYVDNNQELERIAEVERSFTPAAAVWWYTRDSFVYKIINKALRTQDFDALFAMRFFIRGLHEQLVELHKRSSDGSILTLYRGQGLFNADFEQLASKQGGLLSINNFLSTTTDPDVANVYVPREDPEKTPVLMIIRAALSKSMNVPFADIDAFSQFSGNEKEWLFSMGSVFRIDSLKRQRDDEVWTVELTLTSDKDPQLTQLTDHMRKKLVDTNPFVQLGRLMVEMGAFERAKSFFQRSLETEAWSFRCSAIFINLGAVHSELRDLDKALNYYQLGLSQSLHDFPEDHPRLSPIYNNIGSIHWKQGKHELALEYYQKALKTALAAPRPNQEFIANRYNNIATVLSFEYFILSLIRQHKQTCFVDEISERIHIWDAG